MKFRMTFKDPEAIDCLKDNLLFSIQNGNLQEDDYDEALEFARKFLQWSEYLTVEFDTEAATATVIKP